MGQKRFSIARVRSAVGENRAVNNRLFLTCSPMRGPAARRRTDRFPPNARLPLAYRLPGERPAPLPADPHARDARLARLEAVLFLADEPLTVRKIANAAALADTNEARRLLNRLRDLYDADATAFQVEEIAGGYRSHHAPAVARALRTGGEVQLTRSGWDARHHAYRQPIGRRGDPRSRLHGCSPT